jgi:hypothetical protein
MASAQYPILPIAQRNSPVSGNKRLALRSLPLPAEIAQFPYRRAAQPKIATERVGHLKVATNFDL